MPLPAQVGVGYKSKYWLDKYIVAHLRKLEPEMCCGSPQVKYNLWILPMLAAISYFFGSNLFTRCQHEVFDVDHLGKI